MIAGRARLELLVIGTVSLLVLTTLTVLLLVGGRQESPADGAPLPVYRSATAPAAQAPVLEQPSRGSGGRVLGPSTSWVNRTAAQVGIPATALRAYATAELTLRRERRGCHLTWNTLAGIGWIESQHGTVDGRTLLDDGLSSPPVIGPALDGEGFAAIRSTPESATWHGDTTWEHAVGPMQFIASTWTRWSADGDGDGRNDPLDLDDAALAAGRYLCADAHDLATTVGWNAAVHSYNHDQAYVVQVANAANSYAQRTR